MPIEPVKEHDPVPVAYLGWGVEVKVVKNPDRTIGDTTFVYKNQEVRIQSATPEELGGWVNFAREKRPIPELGKMRWVFLRSEDGVPGPGGGLMDATKYLEYTMEIQVPPDQLASSQYTAVLAHAAMHHIDQLMEASK